MSRSTNTPLASATDSIPVQSQGGATSMLMPPPPSTADNKDNPSPSLNPPTAAAVVPAPPVSELSILRTHMQTLTELNNRLQTIRHIPAQLLRPPGTDPHKLEATLLTHGFKELGTIAETVRTEKVQDALKAARKSELADPNNVSSNIRRENLKRRRLPSPESPQPYRETESKESSLLPSPEPVTVRIRLDGLAAYIREHNRSSKNKLHIVAPRKGRGLNCPVTLRFTAPNVVTVYLTLDTSSHIDLGLVVENATAIGSREQKPPRSQSDYMAFQQLSQQLAKVIRSDPFAPVQAYVALLSSYERLFVDTCTNCQRVISAEGHVPPVVRRRMPPSTDPRAPLWDVRHVVCKYEPPPPRASSPGPGNGADVNGGGEGGTVGTV